MWTFTLPLTLLATLVVSSAFAQPIDLVDDFSAIGFLSHPDDDDAPELYRYDNEEEEQQNDLVEADEPRHLEKRSPKFPFDPITKKLKLKLLKKKAKKFAIKLKPFKKPALKKLPKLAVPLGGVGALGGAGALSRVPGGPGRFLPSLPSLPSFG